MSSLPRCIIWLRVCVSTSILFQFSISNPPLSFSLLQKISWCHATQIEMQNHPIIPFRVCMHEYKSEQIYLYIIIIIITNNILIHTHIRTPLMNMMFHMQLHCVLFHLVEWIVAALHTKNQTTRPFSWREYAREKDIVIIIIIIMNRKTFIYDMYHAPEK